MNIYERISESNIKKYGTENKKVLSIIINQYSDRTHFIYEILQNAEDAGASEIKFHLTKNTLEIYHDGRPFDEKDIEGICGIANGTKEDGTRIGHFGIGFKSVYCYTEVPEIYSGRYHFQIKDQLFPEEINNKISLSDDETCMILPFDKKDVSADTACAEIKCALIGKITADSILMLDSISNIEIEVEDYDNKKTINKIKNRLGKFDDGIVYSLGVSTSYFSSNELKKTDDADYLFFTNNKKESSAVVYKVGGTDGKQLLPIKNAKVYAYFPTAKKSEPTGL